MDWWEDEENDWFDKYLPGRDLPVGLEWTPFNVDLTTAPDVTTCMYPGLVSRGTIRRYVIQYRSRPPNITIAKGSAGHNCDGGMRRPGNTRHASRSSSRR